MSASSKKQLRKGKNAAMLTEKQQAQAKEDKKMRLYTGLFVSIIAIVLCVAIAIGVTNTINRSGVIQRNTTAVTIGSREISSAELNYYFVDAVNAANNSWNQQYGNYASLYLQMMGLDLSQPLNSQNYMGSEEMTWADYFAQTAVENARSSYALYDLAVAEGRQLTADESASIDQTLQLMAYYANASGMSNAESYLKAIYGNGATEKSYRQYCEISTLASAYYNAHMDSLTYDDAALRSYESGRELEYNSYSYSYYYLASSRFLTGGTTDAEGNTTYSDEEKAASLTAVKAAADSLSKVTSVEEFDSAIAALEINADVESAASTPCKNVMYSSVSASMRDWVTDSARKAGDVDVLPNETTSSDGSTDTIGYYVVLFQGSSDNKMPLVNVRHILVSFTAGDDEAKKTAHDKLELLQSEWQQGEATAESFGELAALNSEDTGSASNGGLYENVYPGQMVDAFNDWCFDESRQVGDTDIVETSYGYHLMYFAGWQDTTYRDYMIKNDLLTEDMNNWYTGVLENVPAGELNSSKLSMSMVISSAS